MLPEQEIKYDNPEIHATYWSRIFFCWLVPLLKISLHEGIEEWHMSEPLEADRSEYLGNTLEYFWELEILKATANKRTPSFRRALLTMFWNSYARCSLVSFLQIPFGVLIPTLTSEIIFYVANTSTVSMMNGLLSASLLLVFTFLYLMFACHGSLGCTRIAFRCRIACTSLMYRKLMKLSISSLATMTAEEVIALLTVDVYKFEALVMQFQYLWVLPSQFLIVAILVYMEFGYSAVCGCISIAAQGIMINGTFIVIIRNYHKKIAVMTKKRVRALAHFINNIRAIKMYCCEKIFKNVLAGLRKQELQYSRSALYIFGLGCALSNFYARTAVLMPLGISSLYDTNVPSHRMYAMILYYTSLQWFMTARLPITVESFVEGKRAAKKVQKFLMLPEKSFLNTEPARTRRKSGYVSYDSVYASWRQDDGEVYTLENINLEIQPGSFYCIIGDKGSGKSSMLHAILQEIPIYRGGVYKVGSVSYTSQVPWLFTATIKQNIMFGENYFREHYKEVSRVCGLDTDLKSFEHGDRTILDERVVLTSDLKARINLARGVYRTSDIYLFDEPFACIEAEPSKHLFEECMLNHLGDKTRILATRHEGFLSSADYVVVMKNGRIISVSAFGEIPRNLLPKLKRSASVAIRTHFVVPSLEEMHEMSTSALSVASIPFGKGHMGIKSIYNFLEMFKSRYDFLYLLVVILTQLSMNASDLTLMYILSSHESCGTTSHNTPNNTRGRKISPRIVIDRDVNNGCEYTPIPGTEFYIFTGILFTALLISILRVGWYVHYRVRTSRNLHDIAVGKILDSNLEFFRNNIPSCVINRFSRDLKVIDDSIPRLLLLTSIVCCTALGFILIVGILFPLTIVLSALMIAAVIGVRHLYILIAEDLNRIFTNVTLRISTYIASSFEGIPIIRSYKADYLITKDFDSLQDMHTYPYVISMLANKMLGVYLDMVCTVYLFLIVIQAYYVPMYFGPNSAAVGLAMVEIIYLVGTLPFGIKLSAKVNMDMYNVQRLLHFFYLDLEVPKKTYSIRDLNWPSNGRVVFENVFEIHAITDMDELFGLNFTIESGEKVAFTGGGNCGKWAIPSAIYRLERQIGTITIDNVKTSTVSNSHLRKQLGIFPREPMMMPTTIRNNLTIYGNAADTRLWEILDQVELKYLIPSLDTIVEVESNMFTFEQKHLFSLARLLVVKKKVCVIEDWAYEVDPRTEDFIWDVIMTELRESTLLVISKRASVVARCERVYVLDHGKIVEEGNVEELMEDQESILVSTVLSDSALQPITKYMYKELTRRRSKKFN